MYTRTQDKYSVFTYEGKKLTAQKSFLADAKKKSIDGFYPVSEKYEEGSWRSLDFFLIIIGMTFIYLAVDKYLAPFNEYDVHQLPFFLLKSYSVMIVSNLFLCVSLYMIIIKPVGQLIVTYQYQEPEISCQNCGESVRKSASECRYCHHSLIELTSPR